MSDSRDKLPWWDRLPGMALTVFVTAVLLALTFRVVYWAVAS